MKKMIFFITFVVAMTLSSAVSGQNTKTIAYTVVGDPDYSQEDKGGGVYLVVHKNDIRGDKVVAEFIRQNPTRKIISFCRVSNGHFDLKQEPHGLSEVRIQNWFTTEEKPK